MIHANEMMETPIARPIEDGRLNPFQAIPRETLLLGLYSNHKKLVDSCIGASATRRDGDGGALIGNRLPITCHMIIVSFVGANIPTHNIVD